MFDLIIRNGTVVDGTGAAPRRADVAVRDGRIVEVGDVEGEADQVIDATGRIVSPGFIDIHTHYDAQVFWDPYVTPSPLHGVTTVIGGNCGFSIAPLAPEQAGYLTRMLARVEGMPLESLVSGVPWNWKTFREYLDRIEGNVGINMGFLVGHTALRRFVMGDDDARPATEVELAAMERVLHESIEAGGMGFSSTWSTTHNDAEGRAVSSRFATAEELVALSTVVGHHEGTTLEFIPTIARFEDEHMSVMAEMSAAADRPLNWNLLGLNARTVADAEHRLSASDYARARGGRVVALTLPTLSPLRVNFLSGFVLDSLPGWDDLFRLPVAERAATLADPEVRQRLRASALTTTQPGLKLLTRWEKLIFIETYDAANAGLAGREIGSVAAERGLEPFDCLLDIVLADDLRTIFGTVAFGDGDDDWEARLAVWRDDRSMVGGSDSGAHLDMIDTFNVATSLLGKSVRDRKLLPLEEAVHYLTDAPAQLYGIVDRGRVEVGYHADLVVFDADRIAPRPTRLVSDLPAHGSRLYGEADGIDHVIVNGVEIVRSNEFTGAKPGTVLRSGRDTRTVHARA